MSWAAEAPSRIIAVARLARWPNAMIAAAAVVVGAIWSCGERNCGLGLQTQLRTTIWTIVAAVALTAFANAFNDWRDVEIDRVAHPERPLPSAAIGDRTAIVLFTMAGIVALAASLKVSTAMAVASAGILVVMAAYSLWLKKLGMFGNVCVAVLASLPFAYGAWAVRTPGAAVPLFALAVPLHFAREVAKDIDDADADRAHRATLPVALGKHAARAAFAVALIIFLGVLAIISFRRPLLGVLVVPALLVCAAGARRVAIGRPGGPRLLKAAMVLAMVPFVVIHA